MELDVNSDGKTPVRRLSNKRPLGGHAESFIPL